MLGTELFFTVVTLHLYNIKMIKLSISMVILDKSWTYEGNDVMDIPFPHRGKLIFNISKTVIPALTRSNI